MRKTNTQVTTNNKKRLVVLLDLALIHEAKVRAAQEQTSLSDLLAQALKARLKLPVGAPRAK